MQIRMKKLLGTRTFWVKLVKRELLTQDYLAKMQFKFEPGSYTDSVYKPQ